MSSSSFASLLLLFVVFLVGVTQAELLKLTIPLGSSGDMIITYDPYRTNYFLHTHTTDTAMYVVGVQKAQTTDVICRSAVTNQIITGPRGCNSNVPGRAIEHSNCRTDFDAVKQEIESYWSLRKDSSACTANQGGTSCLGPVYVITAEEGSTLLVSNEQLLNSRGVYVSGGWGPRCELETVVPVNPEKPKLNVTTNCEASGNSFTGLYESFGGDDDPDGFLTNVTYVFRRDSILRTQRVLFRRNSSEDSTFHVELATTDGTSTSFYTTRFSSVLGTFTVPTDLLDETVDMGTCDATFTMIPATLPLRLIPPVLYDDVTYPLNVFPEHYYRSRVCNFGVGRLDQNNQLVYPHRPENVPFGGHGCFEFGDTVKIPIEVVPHKDFEDFDEDCSRVWPQNSTFYGYAGTTTYDRDSPVTFTCFFPFVLPDAIQESLAGDRERYVQCKMMGGYVATTTKDLCAIGSWITYCKKGWLYFDERCYYKYDPATDLQYRTLDDDADRACTSLDPKAVATKGAGRYLSAWLQKVYVFRKRVESGFPVRVRVTGRKCECYDYDEVNDAATVKYCSCDVSNFALCSYHRKDHPILWADTDVSPKTLAIMRDGQKGVAHPGKQLSCGTCFPGSSGDRCEKITCVPPIVASNSVGESLKNPLLLFFKICYWDGRGECRDGQPNVCKCNRFYGPPSNLANTTDPYHSIPCMCPSSANHPTNELGFKIGNETFVDSRYGVCNGITSGTCVVSLDLYEGRCECNLRVNMDPDAVDRYEPAWDGRACTCRVSMLPPDGFQMNGRMVERFCNGRGTACPFGERLSEQRLDGSYVVVHDRDQCRSKIDRTKFVDGCVCDDGWTGEACTSPVPKDRSLGIPALLSPFQTHVTFPTRLRVNHVTVLPAQYTYAAQPSQACNVTAVGLADSPSAEVGVWCEYVNVGERWNCDTNTSYFTVIATTLQQDPVCDFQVFDEDFPPCGSHPNDRAARFFSNEQYRGYSVYNEPQSLLYARYGSTTTECMCDSDYTGARCASGVSSYRKDPSFGTASKRVCGETTNPPRGKPTYTGCECNTIGPLKFEGKACEYASVYVQEKGERLICSGNGKPIEAKFQSGTCRFDLLDFQNDALATPYSPVLGDVYQTPTYVFNERDFEFDGHGEGDRRSVIVIQGKSWFMAQGQKVTVDSLSGNVTTTSPSIVKFPLNMTYECPDYVPIPERATANVTIMKIVFECDDSDYGIEECYRTVNYTEMCDPGAADSKDEKACSARTFCKREWIERGEIDHAFFSYGRPSEITRCISKMVWEKDDTTDETLESNTYENVWFLAVNASSLSPLPESTPYGVFHPSNPIDAIIDDALFFAGLVNETQRSKDPSAIITSHSNVLGVGYGIFGGLIPGLPFKQGNFTDEEANFVASLLNNEVCVPPGENLAEKYVWDAFDERIWDEYIVSLVQTDPEAFSENSNNTETVNSTLVLDDLDLNVTEKYFYQGLYGNPLYHTSVIEDWPNWSRENFTFIRRPGRSLFVPSLTNTEEMRKITVTVPYDVVGLQVYGPRGEVCATVLRELRTNDTVTIDCVNAFVAESLAESFKRFNASQELAQEFMDLQYEKNVLWYAPKEFYSVESGNDSVVENETRPFLVADFAVTSRSTSYAGLWDHVRGSILVNHTFPENRPYRDNCKKLGGVLRPYDATRDKKFLENVHSVHLAPRRCTADWQCKKFARDPLNYDCVLDDFEHRPWRGGGLEPDEGSVGDEGGCDCSLNEEGGIWKGIACEVCVTGYGPQTNSTWNAMDQFQKSILDYWPNFTEEENGLYPLFDPNGIPRTFCTLPTDYTTNRPTEVCGGARGWLNRTVLEFTNRTTFLFEKKIVRKCDRLFLSTSNNRTEFVAVQDDTYDYDVHSFLSSSSSSVINVVKGKIFLDGDELEIANDDPCLDTCEYVGDIKLECVDDWYSETMRVTTKEISSYRRRDFFTYWVTIKN